MSDPEATTEQALVELAAAARALARLAYTDPTDGRVRLLGHGTTATGDLLAQLAHAVAVTGRDVTLPSADPHEATTGEKAAAWDRLAGELAAKTEGVRDYGGVLCSPAERAALGSVRRRMWALLDPGHQRWERWMQSTPPPRWDDRGRHGGTPREG